MASKRPADYDPQREDHWKRHDNRVSPPANRYRSTARHVRPEDTRHYRPAHSPVSRQRERDREYESDPRRRWPTSSNSHNVFPSPVSPTAMGQDNDENTMASYDSRKTRNPSFAASRKNSASGVSSSVPSTPRLPPQPSMTTQTASPSGYRPDASSVLQNLVNSIADYTLQKAKMATAEQNVHARKQELDNCPKLAAFQKECQTKYSNSKLALEVLKPHMDATEKAKNDSIKDFTEAWTLISTSMTDAENDSAQARANEVAKQNVLLIEKLEAQDAKHMKCQKLLEKLDERQKQVEEQQLLDKKSRDRDLTIQQAQQQIIKELEAKLKEPNSRPPLKNPMLISRLTALDRQLNQNEKDVATVRVSQIDARGKAERASESVKNLSERVTRVETRVDDSKPQSGNQDEELRKAIEATSKRCSELSAKMDGMKESTDTKDDEVAKEIDRIDTTVAELQTSIAMSMGDVKTNLIQLDVLCNKTREDANKRHPAPVAALIPPVQSAAIDLTPYATKEELATLTSRLKLQATAAETMRRSLLALQDRVNNMTTEHVCSAMLDVLSRRFPLDSISQLHNGVHMLQMFQNATQPLLAELSAGPWRNEIRDMLKARDAQHKLDVDNWSKAVGQVARRIEEKQSNQHGMQTQHMLNTKIEEIKKLVERVTNIELQIDSGSALDSFKARSKLQEDIDKLTIGIKECKKHSTELTQTLEEYKRRLEQLQEQVTVAEDQTRVHQARIVQLQGQLDNDNQQSRIFHTGLQQPGKQGAAVNSPALTPQAEVGHYSKDSQDANRGHPGKGAITTAAKNKGKARNSHEASDESEVSSALGEDTLSGQHRSRSSSYPDIDDEMSKPSPSSATSVATPRSTSVATSNSKRRPRRPINPNPLYDQDERLVHSIFGQQYKSCPAAIQLYAFMRKNKTALSEQHLREMRAIFDDKAEGPKATQDFKYAVSFCSKDTGPEEARRLARRGIQLQLLKLEREAERQNERAT